MGKIVVFRESEWNNNLNRINESVEKFNLLFQESLNLNLIKIKSVEDFKRLIMEAETFIKERIADELPPQSFGIFRLKKQAAVSLLELPDFQKLNQMAKDCAKIETSMALNYCVIKNDKVTIDPVKLEELKRAYTTSTKNADEEKLLSAYHALVEAANTYSKACEKVGLGSLYSEKPLSALFFVASDGTVKQSEIYLLEAWARLQKDLI